MDYDTKDIDFGRLSMLMDVISKVTTICPHDTYILSAAQDEIKEVNAKLNDRITEARKNRLAKDQAEAAKLTQQAQEEVNRQAEFEAKQAATADVKAKQFVKPINVKPGEPNELDEAKQRLAAQNSDRSLLLGTKPDLDDIIRRV